MNLVRIGGETYNLDLLLKYVEHDGQREVGAGADSIDPQPVFGTYRFAVLHFVGGESVTLDGFQTRAFLDLVAEAGSILDLDGVREAALGPVFLHGTEVGDVTIADIVETDDAPDGEPDPDRVAVRSFRANPAGGPPERF